MTCKNISADISFFKFSKLRFVEVFPIQILSVSFFELLRNEFIHKKLEKLTKVHYIYLYIILVFYRIILLKSLTCLQKHSFKLLFEVQIIFLHALKQFRPSGSENRKKISNLQKKLLKPN